ncbi:coagulation factor III, tissue factor a [Cynoglossus semilaevis]|uniref:Tissue factor n=1 Tax=Cynoglossus semilaevis TaxID=244447 RepID=A0A3P8VJY0_CYNSE|nr:tissue factor [Cynoglossus semilaevis]
MDFSFCYILFYLYLHCTSASDNTFPQAQNITWKSVNFKTILSWVPKPSSHYAYTVEFSVLGGNKERNPHCIRSSANLCDLSSSMTDLNACYTADVLSEPPMGVTSDLIEFPYTSSPQFCPYKDTEIGRPDFKLKMSQDKKTTTLYVTDPLTAVFKDDQQLTIRDVFSDQLQYKVTYRKNKSTGKKVHFSQTNIIEMTDLDRGVSYCFNVQAFFPSRSIEKQLGELSHTQCSDDNNQSIFEVYSITVIAAAIFFVLLLLGIIVAVIVVCCKCRRKALKKEKEEMPLQGV